MIDIDHRCQPVLTAQTIRPYVSNMMSSD